MKRYSNFFKYSLAILVVTLLSTVSVKAATYTVKQDGSGNFTSIAQGVASVPSGSTLMIYPGVYNEHVDIINKTVNLIGTDRNTCVLQYETSHYTRVPLNFGAGTIQNLTIKGYRSGSIPAPVPVISSSPVTSGNRAPGEALSQAEIDAYVAYVRGQSAAPASSAPIAPAAPSLDSHVPGEPLSQAEIDAYVAYVRGQSASPTPATPATAAVPAVPTITPANATGYAIHLDQDYIYGKSVLIKNCNIISEYASCIGMGLRGGASVTITGCIFTSRSQGIVFFHDTNNPGLCGNASLNFTSNTMNSNGSFFIMTTALSPACNVNLTFNSNYVSGNTNCAIVNLYQGAGQGWMGLNNYFLSASSVGNNVAFLNRQ